MEHDSFQRFVIPFIAPACLCFSARSFSFCLAAAWRRRIRWARGVDAEANVGAPLCLRWRAREWNENEAPIGAGERQRASSVFRVRAGLFRAGTRPINASPRRPRCSLAQRASALLSHLPSFTPKFIYLNLALHCASPSAHCGPWHQRPPPRLWLRSQAVRARRFALSPRKGPRERTKPIGVLLTPCVPNRAFRAPPCHTPAALTCTVFDC